MIKINPDSAENFIVKLAEFLRVSININQKTSTLEEELINCRKYIDLQKVRFGDSIQYSEDIDNEYKNNHIPYFTLITLAENTFKHNAMTEENPIFLSISAKNNFLIVKNNIQPKVVNDSNNIGLDNLNKRFKILTGKEIEIIKNENEFCVKLALS